MPKMVHFGEFLKTWSFQSNSATRQVTFERTKHWWKMSIFKCSIATTFWVIFKHLCNIEVRFILISTWTVAGVIYSWFFHIPNEIFIYSSRGKKDLRADLTRPNKPNARFLGLFLTLFPGDERSCRGDGVVSVTLIQQSVTLWMR